MEVMLSIYTFIVGLCVGSFLNVLAYRLPLELSIISPGSHCPGCKQPVRARDNIPVLSYFLLRGKCRDCGTKISPLYPIVEATNAALWLVCLFAFKFELYSVIAMMLCSCLLCVLLVDAKHMFVPDSMVIAIAVLGLISMLFQGIPLLGGVRELTPLERLLGGAAAGGFFLLLHFGGALLLKKDALGLGDVKLMAASGFLLGWQGSAIAAFLAALVACAVMFVKKFALKKDVSQPFAFAPYLALGIAVSFFLWEIIWNWYMGLFMF